MPLQTLQPGYRSAYWLDEIRFSVFGNAITNGATAPVMRGLTHVVRAKFQTGSFQFSKTAIPVGLYAPRTGEGDIAALTVAGSGATGDVVAVAYVRWPLPQPLYMPAGDAVQCNIEVATNAIMTAAGASVGGVQVAYLGRMVAPGAEAPVSRRVPWVAWWSKLGSVGYAATTDEFRNPFTKRLMVQRFTSRSYTSVAAVRAVPNWFSEDTEFWQMNEDTSGVGSGLSYADVRIFDSSGYAVVPEYTAVGDVFDATRGAWTFSRELGPREQIDMQMRTRNTPITFGGEAADFITSVGMVGYREEET